MNKWSIASACVTAVLCFASVSSAQTTRNRTQRVTVTGCLIRGSEYAEVPNVNGYVLRDVQSAGGASASYGTETTGKPNSEQDNHMSRMRVSSVKVIPGSCSK